ncbi:hypothetical protein FKP32DRAFT_1367731 [Trametes sanguinea]|nr:hypothetical protein FKP32DRAFT_1367731 [Trametes sanguinea]
MGEKRDSVDGAASSTVPSRTRPSHQRPLTPRTFAGSSPHLSIIPSPRTPPCQPNCSNSSWSSFTVRRAPAYRPSIISPRAYTMTTPGVHTGHTNPGHRGTSFAALISPSRLLDALLISDRRRLLARKSSADPLQGYLNNLNITNRSYVTVTYRILRPSKSNARPRDSQTVTTRRCPHNIIAPRLPRI